MQLPPKDILILFTTIVKHGFQRKKKEAISTALPPVLSQISVEQFEDLKELCEKYNKYYFAATDLEKVEKEWKQAKSELDALSKEYDFKICQNCGTVVQ